MADLSRYQPQSEAFRLGRATWLMSTLLKLVDQGRLELSLGLEYSIREFVETEERGVDDDQS